MTTKEAYRTLAERSGHGNSERLLSILAKAMTPEEAALLVELPASPDSLAAKLSLDPEAIEDKIRELTRRGLVVPSRRGARFPVNLGFLHEAMLSSAPELIPPDLPRLWRDFYVEEWREEIGGFLGTLETQTLRVIPAQKAVPANIELLPWESVKDIVEAAKSRAVRNCACRVMVRDCDSPVHNCVQFNRRADYALERGSGRRVSVDEALGICRAAEEVGLVPMVGNIGLLERMDYICYCCSCCCTGLDPLKRVGKLSVGYAKSRFLARVDPQACTGCQECLERCHFDAIEMKELPGSKLLEAAIDVEKCFGCGLCVIQCQPEAITLNLVRPPDHIPSINATVIP